MTNSQRPDKEKDKMTERILNLTLEIIYLLTGEDYTVVKKVSDTHVTSNTQPCLSRSVSLGSIMEPPSPSVSPERGNDVEILEVTQKIIELLTGEVPIRCQDVTVYFSMEEWEYLEGHKDLYKDVIIARQPALTSPDGSSNKNPPERCPRPLYSRDSIQEYHDVPQEEDQEDGAEDLSDNTYQEDPNISEDFEDEEVNICKAEDLYDEEMSFDEPSKDEVPPEISTDRPHRKSKKKKPPFIGPVGRIEEYDIAADYPIVNSMPRNLHQGRCHADVSFPPFMYAGSLPTTLTQRGPKGEDEAFLCYECGKCFNKQSSLDRHRQLMHIWEKPYSCSECGKCFGHKISLVRHQRIHSNENTFSCLLCGRCFAQKSHLVEHERQHTGEKPYACMECGKCFAVKRALVSHESTHLGQKQFCCPECGKCFTRRAYLFSHQQVHLRHKMV